MDSVLQLLGSWPLVSSKNISATFTKRTTGIVSLPQQGCQYHWFSEASLIYLKGLINSSTTTLRTRKVNLYTLFYLSLVTLFHWHFNFSALFLDISGDKNIIRARLTMMLKGNIAEIWMDIRLNKAKMSHTPTLIHLLCHKTLWEAVLELMGNWNKRLWSIFVNITTSK